MKKKKPWSSLIQNQRKKLNLTQRELADAIGVTVNAIISFENGTRFPSYYCLMGICDILKLKPEDFINIKRHPEYYNRELNQIIRTFIPPENGWIDIFDSKINKEFELQEDKTSIVVCDGDGIPILNAALDDDDILKLIKKAYEIKKHLYNEYRKLITKHIRSLLKKTNIEMIE